MQPIVHVWQQYFNRRKKLRNLSNTTLEIYYYLYYWSDAIPNKINYNSLLVNTYLQCPALKIVVAKVQWFNEEYISKICFEIYVKTFWCYNLNIFILELISNTKIVNFRIKQWIIWFWTVYLGTKIVHICNFSDQIIITLSYFKKIWT